MRNDRADAESAKTTALTVRLASDRAEQIKRIARRERRSVSEVGARIVEEWLRMERHPQLEFRSVMGERVACVKGRLEVWQVVLVGLDNGMDVGKTSEHLVLRPEQVHAAFAYAEEYPDEIAEPLARNDGGLDRLKITLPSISAFVADISEERHTDVA